MRMNAVRSEYVKPMFYSGNKLEADHENVFSYIDESDTPKRDPEWHKGSVTELLHKAQLSVNFSTVGKKSPISKLRWNPKSSNSLASLDGTTWLLVPTSSPWTLQKKLLSLQWILSPTLHSAVLGAV